MKKWYALDTETSNSDINILKQYTRVWLWDIFDPEDRKHYNGYDIEDMMYFIFTHPSATYYIHNLKFDGSFILSWCLKNGFYISNNGQDMSISTLITDRLVWYTFTIHCGGRKYKFVDSMKKIIGSLEKAAEDFELPIRKGSIDYRLHRDKGYIPTKEEIDYVHNDTEILADILQYYFDNGMSALTNASDAMKAFKDIITPTGYKAYFPVLPKEIDDFIRDSYKGGFCYLNPKFFNIDLGEVFTYDVKSMYPSRMAYCDLPYGVPMYYEGKYVQDDTMPLYIQEIYVDCKLKEGHIPVIQSKSFLTIKLNYLTDTKGELKRLVLTHLDLELLLEHYDIYELIYTQGYKFRSSNQLFRSYVDHYFGLKEISTGAKKQLYKIFLNSLYGKFAMMCERSQAIPRYENGKLKFDRTEPEEVDAMYTAVASYITASARVHLLKGIYANLENFIYCDTDSIHLIKPAVGIEISKKLGQFDIENGYYENGVAHTYIKKARYLGQKCYMLCGENKKGEYELKKIAGAPSKVKEQINFKNFRINFKSDKDEYPKFRMKQVDGGVLLIPTDFTIKNRFAS